jgi:uncharacterized membrane protein
MRAVRMPRSFFAIFAGLAALALVELLGVRAARAAPPDPTVAVTNPAARVDAFAHAAVEQGLVTQARAAHLVDEWSTVRIGDLSKDVGLEEALVARSVAHGDLSATEGEALARLAAARRLSESVPLPQQAAPDATDWVATVVTWLPRVGGSALAIGVLWMIGSALARRGRVARAVASAVTAIALWRGAMALYAAERSAVAAALVIAGCIASGYAASLVLPERRDGAPLRAMGACMAAVWGLVACVLASAPAAYLSALAFATTLGVDQTGLWTHRHDARVRLRGAGAGLVLVAAGFVLRSIHARSSLILVHPLWVVGLCTVFTGSALGWDWRELDGDARYATTALAAGALVLGVVGGFGVFVAAGGIALAATAFLTLVEIIPRRLPASVTLVLLGAVMVGATFLLDANWALVVRYVSAES